MLSRGGSERYFELMMASAVALTCAHSLALSLSLSPLAWGGGRRGGGVGGGGGGGGDSIERAG